MSLLIAMIDKITINRNYRTFVLGHPAGELYHYDSSALFFKSYSQINSQNNF